MFETKVVVKMSQCHVVTFIYTLPALLELSVRVKNTVSFATIFMLSLRIVCAGIL